ncbi:L,D-transpeptidase [Actinoplanes sp. LDG1-06]|uniref:L,D-transpeptidase n=1 Tax=Paractinoplanes ovalisporus TaxID=2810368 RepID=A0ABS2A825_9ACTN|nr:L,D-transpeptidase [Actinoplanes ovalisporus]MBM2615473.1 L,D-transpeptidase [Actinoplanes ovalisporus]
MAWLRGTRLAVLSGVLVVAAAAGSAAAAKKDGPGLFAVRQVPAAAPTAEPVPVAAPAPKTLPVMDYWDSPRGFPRDPDPMSTRAVTEGLRPRHRLAVYDTPGGKPRAFLGRSISGMPVTVPIVERRQGWAGVLLPSVNRRVGWVPPGGWETRRLGDQLFVDLSERRLTWLRDGREHGSWEVAVGSRRTPTPQGRTYVMGRTITSGSVYGGLDALVLGAVPDDRDALAASLRDGHTAIHGWRDRSAFGRSISNGCVRMPLKAQQALLDGIPEGSVVHVVE